MRRWLSHSGPPAGEPPARRRSRDRHGRGMRGPLAPAEVPLSTTRAERFDDLVLEVVEHLRGRWSEQLDTVEFAVDDVPNLDDWQRDFVPLARTFPAAGTLPARIVVYRRPVETRTTGEGELTSLVHDVVVEEVAELLGMEPDQLDPGYGGSDEEP